MDAVEAESELKIRDTSAESTEIHVCDEPDANTIMHSRQGLAKRKASRGGSHGQGQRNLASQMTFLTIAGYTVILYSANKDDNDKANNSSQAQEGGGIQGKRNLRLHRPMLMAADPSTIESNKERLQLSIKRCRFSYRERCKDRNSKSRISYRNKTYRFSIERDCV